MSALEDRIRYEEEAKTKQCGVRGCTNQATHTWSGHPTCDACGTPGRRKLGVPVVIGYLNFVDERVGTNVDEEV